jgi:hypothetical protein
MTDSPWRSETEGLYLTPTDDCAFVSGTAGRRVPYVGLVAVVAIAAFMLSKAGRGDRGGIPPMLIRGTSAYLVLVIAFCMSK